MKDELAYIGKKIIANHEEMGTRIESILNEGYKKELTENRVALAARAEFRSRFIHFIGEALLDSPETVTEKVTQWAEEAALFAIRNNLSLTNVLRAASMYRNVIWESFTDELEAKQFAPITMVDVSKIVDPLLDLASSVIGRVYEEHNNQQMKMAHLALEELSVPLVPVAEGIAVIPIIGEIDTYRAKLIMDISLKEGTKRELDYIILDVSGVKIIDTMVSNEIFQILYSLRLIGIEPIITGIRPEVAQTNGNLGISYEWVKTRATMQQALEKLGFRHMQDS